MMDIPQFCQKLPPYPRPTELPDLTNIYSIQPGGDN